METQTIQIIASMAILIAPLYAMIFHPDNKLNGRIDSLRGDHEGLARELSEFRGEMRGLLRKSEA